MRIVSARKLGELEIMGQCGGKSRIREGRHHCWARRNGTGAGVDPIWGRTVVRAMAINCQSGKPRRGEKREHWVPEELGFFVLDE